MAFAHSISAKTCVYCMEVIEYRQWCHNKFPCS